MHGPDSPASNGAPGHNRGGDRLAVASSATHALDTAGSAAPTATAPAGHRSARPADRWGLPLLVVIVGMFMSVLDTSIVNVAVPTIQKEYNVTTDDIQWIVTAYMLCLGVVVPTSAWCGDRLGLRRMYLVSLVSFGVFSALCGMAPTLPSLIGFRVLQAVPGGMLPVTCLTILYRMVPAEKMGTAMGLYGLGIVVAPGVGPTLGGYLVEYVNWRLIFYINVPIGVIGAIAAVAVLPPMPGRPRRRFDLRGFVCIAGGMFALLLALSEGQTWAWTSYRILILLAAAINLVLLFVAIELGRADPLLDVRVFTHWAFVNSLLLIAILSIGLFAVLFYVPLFVQEAQNLTPWHTGLVLLPQALVMMVTMPTAGLIYDRIGPRWPAVVGLTLCGVGTLLLTRISIDPPRPELIGWMMIRAAGLGLAMMPIMTGGLSALPATIVSSGSAFNTLTQRVTASLGLAVLTALATTQQAQFMANRAALPPTGANTDPRVLAMEQQGPGGLIGLWQHTQLEAQAQAFSNVFLIAAICTLAGVVLALTLRSGKPTPGTDSEPAEIG
jgi:EmrB/QacA subfamily drug resistance transporter